MKYALGSAITPAGDPPAVHLEVERLALTRRQSGDILGQGRDDLTGDVEELEGEAERLWRSRPPGGRPGGEGGPPEPTRGGPPPTPSQRESTPPTPRPPP